MLQVFILTTLKQFRSIESLVWNVWFYPPYIKYFSCSHTVYSVENVTLFCDLAVPLFQVPRKSMYKHARWTSSHIFIWTRRRWLLFMCCVWKWNISKTWILHAHWLRRHAPYVRLTWKRYVNVYMLPGKMVLPASESSDILFHNRLTRHICK